MATVLFDMWIETDKNQRQNFFHKSIRFSHVIEDYNVTKIDNAKEKYSELRKKIKQRVNLGDFSSNTRVKSIKLQPIQWINV